MRLTRRRGSLTPDREEGFLVPRRCTRPLVIGRLLGLALQRSTRFVINFEGNRMSAFQHVDSLRTKHASLENQIEQEEARPKPDDTLIADLKRQKLRLKDEIANFERPPQ
jgi:hypothetical protein